MWHETCFLWHELANHLSAVDMYVLSLTCNAGMKYYMRNLLKLAVFDVTELSLRSAWTILSHVHCKQVAIPTSLRQTEFLHNKRVLTTGADWAARKGHLPLLQWLLLNTEEVCTTYAFDLAARNGHMNVLLWLHDNGLGGTRTSADWAAYTGHLHIVKWLYDNTNFKCSENATMIAAGNGDLEMLLWLHAQGVTCNTSCANFGFACEHEGIMQFLESVGCKRCIDEANTNIIKNIRHIIECERLPSARN